jgi:hypothetical protein
VGSPSSSFSLFGGLPSPDSTGEIYNLYRDGILGHQFKKRQESFAPCYSQSLLADIKENILFSGLKNPYN